MMTVEEMRAARERLHYTYEMIATRSGVPLPTVQKVFSGKTQRPHYKTLAALEAVFRKAERPAVAEYTDPINPSANYVKESGLAYDTYGDSDSKDTAQLHPKYKIPVRRQGDYTTDDLEQIPDDIRVELIDGVIYDLASPTSVHQTIVFSIGTMMKNYAREHGYHCMPYISPLDVQFDRSRKNRVQPDLLVICEHDSDTQSRTIDSDDAGAASGKPSQDIQAPDFVMEVVSPSSKQVDMLVKLNKYYSVGVREYWIVDPSECKIIVYDFEHNDLAHSYSFEDEVPVAISGGDLKIDFTQVQADIDAAERIERSRGWNMLRL